MRLAVIGTGYVGLVAGTCFADSGNDVLCLDADAEKIKALQSGHVPMYEPGLEELIRKNVAEGRLHFATSGLEHQLTDVIFIAVGTPTHADGTADLTAVEAATDTIADAIKRKTIVVMKSTVPPGTTDHLARRLRERTEVPTEVVSNPEFLKEGAALDDFLKPDRIVIGTSSDWAAQVMTELYAPFVRTEHPILRMDTRSAELTKYASNAMLAMRISFINEMALLAEKLGADIDLVRKGMGADSRIGYPFLFPGIGYGGSCFPKDVKALGTLARTHGLPSELFHAVEQVNERQKQLLVEKALGHFNGSLEGKTCAVWGLAFKPKTDDVREAPSLTTIRGLLNAGAKVRVFDPIVRSLPQGFGQVTVSAHAYDALHGADALFLATEWNEFRHPDFERMKQSMKSRVIFDGRNIFNPKRMRELGFAYYGVGRS